MAYVKPQVLVFQEFTIVPAEITEPLRAHIAGPHAALHRYNVSDEKSGSRVGAYDPLNDTCYPWPSRKPGSVVDQDYVKVFVENALLNYYSHDISEVGVVISPVANKRNWVQADTLAFKASGANSRSAVFGDRDVKVGDVAYLRCVLDDEDCTEVALWTEVAGFASAPVASVIKPATADSANKATVTSQNAADYTSVPSATASPTTGYNYLQIAGAKNCVKLVEVVADDYDGRADGDLTETYTIQVVKSSVAGCETAAKLRIRSASGRDDVLEVNAPALSTIDSVDPEELFAVGTRGLKVRFAPPADTEDCTADATTAGVAASQFVVGQKWEVRVRQSFTAVTAVIDADGAYTTNSDGEIVGAYTGDKNDIYVVEVVNGGDIDGPTDSYPQVMVRTAKGLDFSGPHEVTVADGVDAESAEIAIGTKGVKIRFNAPTGFSKGDKFYIAVVAGANGPVRRLILRDNLPADMLDVATLDLKLFIKDTIQVSKNRLGFAPQTNYWFEDTQICLQEGIVAYHPEWTAGGLERPLPVTSGTVYVEYREWLADLADEVNGINNVADLDVIAGPLDPDNPLKWGVYKALTNSNGTVVQYTAVADPYEYDDNGRVESVKLDNWAEVLERIKGRDDIYNLVPMTFDRRVQNLWAAHINAESNETANNWKAGFFALRAEPNQKVVGAGVPIAGVLGETIADEVMAVLSDDPEATDTQYTLLTVPGTDSDGVTTPGYFITNDVRPGDIVRYNFSTDGFGEEQYDEYVVDRVLSENSLLLFTGADAAVTSPQRMEIWHSRNRNEVADNVAEQAGSLSNRRIVAVWPDQVAEAGTVQPGYYLAAALAGLASGVVPHQPLTNVEVAGFDDFSRSYKYFNETQLNRLAEAGVWIVTEDKDGTPYNRHALTTDNLDLNRREEMIRRNVDSMSYLFFNRLKPYIGRTNAQAGMLNVIKYDLTAAMTVLATSGTTAQIGSQLIGGDIALLQIHPLLADRIQVVLDLVVPAPLNNIELRLVI